MAGSDPEREVRRSLRRVLDPCSCFSGDPTSIVDLGLVDDVSVDDGTARIELVLTTPMCTYFMDMSEEIERRVDAVDGVQETRVVQATDKVWTPDRMSEDERRTRRERFAESVDRQDVVPYARRTE